MSYLSLLPSASCSGRRIGSICNYCTPRLCIVLKAAGLATETQVEIKIISQIASSRFNLSLYQVVEANSALLGDGLAPLDFWGASSDYGNVSQLFPSLYALIKTHDPGIPWHSREVAERGISNQAHLGMIRAAKILALSAIDLLINDRVFEHAKADFLNPKDQKGS